MGSGLPVAPGYGMLKRSDIIDSAWFVVGWASPTSLARRSHVWWAMPTLPLVAGGIIYGVMFKIIFLSAEVSNC